jgi:hypothetical protein
MVVVTIPSAVAVQLMMMRMVVTYSLTQDGHCWATCCPNPGQKQCGAFHNASAIPGCDASCEQHATQSAVFARMKASAAKQGRRPPHAVMYMNSVYLWPFDAAKYV